MMRLFAVAVLFLLAGLQLPAQAAPLASKPEAAFKKAFPQVPMDSITESQIKGAYEIVSGQNILYYFPENDLLVVGEIWTKDMKNLTGEKKQALKAKNQEQTLKKLKDLNLDKAVKVGSGAKKVIEFTDPDCPYCRKASAALKNRTDITRYVFLTPLAHPNAVNKVHYILAAKDQEKAYHEMMEGKPLPAEAVEYGKEIKDQAAEFMNIARSLAIDGTPTFFVNGQLVVGADMERIDSLLK
jgi:thiol:disulfide interchange protein DsbC